MNIPNTMMRNAISLRVLIVSGAAGAAGIPSIVGDALFAIVCLRTSRRARCAPSPRRGEVNNIYPMLSRTFAYRAAIGSTPSGSGLVLTVVITDMPGRSRFSRATENGTRMRTGTR